MFKYFNFDLDIVLRAIGVLALYSSDWNYAKLQSK